MSEQFKRIEFKAKLTPYLEDERKTTREYNELAGEAEAIGLLGEANALRSMASDENKHHDTIESIMNNIQQLFDKDTSFTPHKSRLFGTEYPMPGDVVIVTRSDDTLIKPGAKGVIEGMEGQRKDGYQVTFNWAHLPWWESGAINASGGPSRFIKASDLERTGKTTDQDFHYFPHGAGRDMAEIKKHTVLVWYVDLTQPPYASRKSETPRGNLLNFNDFQKKLLDTLAFSGESPGMLKYAQENMTALYNDYQSRGEIFDTWVVHLGLSEPRKFRTSEQDQRFKEKLPELMGENSNTYEITKRHIYSLAEKLHLLVYEDQKKQNPKFGEETWQLWSRVVISEKRDWWYIDVHNTRFSVGKYTGDTYRTTAHIGKIAQLTADDLFKAM